MRNHMINLHVFIYSVFSILIHTISVMCFNYVIYVFILVVGFILSFKLMIDEEKTKILMFFNVNYLYVTLLSYSF